MVICALHRLSVHSIKLFHFFFSAIYCVRKRLRHHKTRNNTDEFQRKSSYKKREDCFISFVWNEQTNRYFGVSMSYFFLSYLLILKNFCISVSVSKHLVQINKHNMYIHRLQRDRTRSVYEAIRCNRLVCKYLLVQQSIYRRKALHCGYLCQIWFKMFNWRLNGYVCE